MAKILIVDDSAFARKRLKVIFERQGHEIVGLAGDGDQAMDLYQSLHPDIVSLDHLMEGKNGEQVLAEMLLADPAVKVVVVSGSGEHGIEDRFLQAGAKAFVPKFNTEEDFAEAIQHVLEA